MREPGCGATVEGPQGEHDEEPASGFAKPIGQSSQSAPELDPLRGLNAPASHGVHRLRPLTLEKEPGAQGEHDTAAGTGLLDPGLHSLHELRPNESP